ncbi:MAG TPA: hypothetical protein PK047_12350 [Saprospiraceae bacterium]|nr:hypothetical protein [Saprospiraceae bacterium]HRO09648.1 hypothetical protein [Saprospiraceae bacterium]HRP42904.1 hypothetical protein [Saprospiraceae bacterium]
MKYNHVIHIIIASFVLIAAITATTFQDAGSRTMMDNGYTSIPVRTAGAVISTDKTPATPTTNECKGIQQNNTSVVTSPSKDLSITTAVQPQVDFYDYIPVYTDADATYATYKSVAQRKHDRSGGAGGLWRQTSGTAAKIAVPAAITLSATTANYTAEHNFSLTGMNYKTENFHTMNLSQDGVNTIPDYFIYTCNSDYLI